MMQGAGIASKNHLENAAAAKSSPEQRQEKIADEAAKMLEDTDSDSADSEDVDSQKDEKDTAEADAKAIIEQALSAVTDNAVADARADDTNAVLRAQMLLADQTHAKLRAEALEAEAEAAKEEARVRILAAEEARERDAAAAAEMINQLQTAVASLKVGIFLSI